MKSSVSSARYEAVETICRPTLAIHKYEAKRDAMRPVLYRDYERIVHIRETTFKGESNSTATQDGGYFSGEVVEWSVLSLMLWPRRLNQDLPLTYPAVFCCRLALGTPRRAPASSLRGAV